MINNLQRKTLISSKMRVINRACFDENGPSQLVGVEARTVGNSLNNNMTWLLIIAALAPICRCLPFIQINHFFHFIFDTTLMHSCRSLCNIFRLLLKPELSTLQDKRNRAVSHSNPSIRQQHTFRHCLWSHLSTHMYVKLKKPFAASANKIPCQADFY